MDQASMLFLYKFRFLCYNPFKGADTMKKQSLSDKMAQKSFNSPEIKKNWAVHMKNYGPILKSAFAEDYQARVSLCTALTQITSKNFPQALLKLNGLQKHLVSDADKAAFFFAMGLFCEYAGKYDEMAGLYSQANDLKHDFYLPYLKVAKYALDTRDYGKAEASYRAAIRCFPAALTDKDKQLLGSSYTNLASCLVMMHRYEEADAALASSRNLLPMFPGRAAPEAILHALWKESAELLSCLNSLKTLVPFAYDSIKKSTDQILSGTEPQFFAVPVSETKITAFWDWFSGTAADLTKKLDGQDYEAVMTAIGEHLLEAFPFLEQRPYVALGKNNTGYVVQLKDMYAVGVAEGYRKLLAACPEDMKIHWLFDVIH